VTYQKFSGGGSNGMFIAVWLGGEGGEVLNLKDKKKIHYYMFPSKIPHVSAV